MPREVQPPLHDRAVIISTGDEILTGQLLDRNAGYLSDRLVSIGILPVEHMALPDEQTVLVESLRRACRQAPLVIMSGGLGPTDGDLTRSALAGLLGEALVLDQTAREDLRAKLAARGRELIDRQERQAYRPPSARCLANALGTAPGLHAAVPTDGAHRVTDLFCLPGPPGELRPMFDAHVLPILRPNPDRPVLLRLLHVVGIAEADSVSRLGALTERERDPLVGVTASGGILTIRIRSERAGSKELAARAVDQVEAAVRTALRDHVFAKGGFSGVEALCRTVLDALKARRQMLATVESCTGGMLGEFLTTIPGSSAAFVGGFITYADPLKVALGVKQATLDARGAVSEPTCREMALCGLGRAGSDHAIAITGIAGPDGGSADKPVGTVYIGVASLGSGSAPRLDIRRFWFSGDRDDIRRRSCVTALAMLHFALGGHEPGSPALLWQVAERA